MPLKKKPCSDCGLNFNARSLKKKNNKLLCHNCIHNYRTMMPRFNPSNKPKHFNQNNSLINKKTSRKETIQPHIPGANKNIKKKNPQLNLTKHERNFLIQDRVNSGMDYKEAINRLNNTSNYLKELKKNIKTKNLQYSSDKKINKNKQFLESLK